MSRMRTGEIRGKWVVYLGVTEAGLWKNKTLWPGKRMPLLRTTEYHVAARHKEDVHG